jgi:hypothetical protein
MAPKIAGAGTATETATTASAETAASSAEPEAQKNDAFEKQLTELQGKLTELTAERDKVTQEAKDATASRLQYEAMYKGLQNQTTKTLQNAAQTRKDLEQAKLDRAELAQIREALDTVTNHLLDEDERKELGLRQRELKLKQAEQAITEAAQQAVQESTAQATASPQQYIAPETTKKDFVEYYFPGLGIDPNDSRIDWANDVPQAENARAFQRFTNSIVRIKNEMDQAKNQDVVAQLQKQAEEQLAAIKAEQETKNAQTAAEIEQAKVTAKADARKEAEAKLRKLGADVSGEHADDGARKSFGQQMVEQLDDSLLQTKSGQAEYARRVEAIKQQRVRGNF